MPELAPVVLFVYNRPDHVRQALESFAACLLSGDTELFVFADGPKHGATEEERRKIAETQAVVCKKKWCGRQHLIISDRNKGLAKSVIDGVTQIVGQYGRVIVLEDDLVCAPHFLSYMNKALDVYENEDHVISITGYIYPVQEKLPETFFLRGADCWSWATWKRGWDLFNSDGSKLLYEIEERGLQDDFDFEGSYSYTQMLRDQVDGKNSSWAIRWYASAFLRDKLTLYPGQSLVRNIGMDGSGTHCGRSKLKWDGGVCNHCPNIGGIELVESAIGRTAVRNFFLTLRKKPSLRKRLITRLKRLVR
jgi:glycosyltransferase involved in cell wall biosynthesis